LQRG
jgi:DNA replicative helicase MCM subunit Mcm2 (Cdc46/Mcm family)